MSANPSFLMTTERSQGMLESSVGFLVPVMGEDEGAAGSLVLRVRQLVIRGTTKACLHGRMHRYAKRTVATVEVVVENMVMLPLPLAAAAGESGRLGRRGDSWIRKVSYRRNEGAPGDRERKLVELQNENVPSHGKVVWAWWSSQAHFRGGLSKKCVRCL